MDKPTIIQKIKALDSLTNDEKADLIEMINETKLYGLVWEDKLENVEKLLLNKLPVLREVPERQILANGLEKTSTKAIIPSTAAPTLFEGTGNPEDDVTMENPEQSGISSIAIPNHILIEGDNFHALTALTFTHENCIDIIYIDPPYNTGSKEDFIFNDHYVDKEDAFRHSKWLSFMEKRLNIAKRLLADDGVIFCSIGDDEIAQLTMLFNEVFRDDNKLGCISRISKTAGDQGNYFSSSKDYILVYTKNKGQLANFKDDVDIDLFKKVETSGARKGEYYRDDVAFYQATLGVRPNLRYFVECPDGSLVIPPGNVFPIEKKDAAKVIPQSDNDKVWRWSADKYLAEKHLIVFKQTKQSPCLDENGNKSKWNLYTKSYLNDRSEKGASPRDYLDQFINRKGADFIKQYDIDFSYSKPFELIQHLIKITNKPNDIKVLDFFAGSGTTLHSVLSLNASDKGQRTCILVTNNENKICDDVTYPRCQRIINKYVNSKGKVMPYFPDNNLRYYRTEFVNREKTTKNKKELTLLATELLCIKEDIYSELTSIGSFKFKPGIARCFCDKGRYLIAIYDEEIIEELIPVIEAIDSQFKVKIYVFAPGQYPFSQEFEDVMYKVELCALPDAIYKAYLNVLPKKTDRRFSNIDDLIEEDQPEEEAEIDLLTENNTEL